MRHRLLPIPLALVATLAACEDDPVAPRPLAGAWLLHSIGGVALPVLVVEQRGTHGSGVAGTRREWIEGFRLAIDPSRADTVQMVRRVEWELDAGENPSPGTIVEQMAAPGLVRGDTLCYHPRVPEFTFACADAQVLRRRGEQLAAHLSMGPAGTTGAAEWVFAREAP